MQITVKLAGQENKFEDTLAPEHTTWHSIANTNNELFSQYLRIKWPSQE